ncbi:hypothetical protein Tco_0438080 [Tanacetum coccineum]
MPCSCDRRGMWDRRVSIGQTLNENSGMSILEPLMELIIERGVGNCNHSTSNEMPLRDGWTYFLHEPSIPGISLKEPLSKGTVHHQRLPSSLKKSATSSRKETKHYTKLGNGPIPGMTPVQALTTIQTIADHSQKWHDRLSSRNMESSSSEGITAIVNKLENLGRDMKKLKENIHAIQVGCKICEGAHLNKDCPLKEEVKSMEEVKYGEIVRPFPNNNINDSKFNRRGYDQPSSGERRLSLSEVINKYMEESSKRHDEQDEWLKKFYQSTEASREAHDKIIQGLETKVKTLANEVKGRANNGKFEECKAIYNKKQETDDSRMAEALAALEATLKKKKEEPKKEK